jgi:hypothetical protein
MFATRRIVGAALGSIIATIMIAHIRRISAAYPGVQDGAINIIWPPPISIVSIAPPAPSSR